MQNANSHFHRARRALVCGLAVGALLAFAAPAAWADAVLTRVSGSVDVGRGEPARWSPASVGDAVAPDDRIRTGPDGRVEIRMGAGTLRVHENSMLRLPASESEADRVDLEAGRSLFDILRRDGRRFEVHTPTVVVSVKGTRFGVDAGVEIGEVAVYHGVVGVRELGAAGMMETLVREGFLATGGVGIPIELDVSSAPDPWNAWLDLEAAARELREAPHRLSETERARATLHRVTNAEVISRAAERRPEVAERLKKVQAERGLAKRAEREARKTSPEPDGRDRPRGRPGADSRPMPAAPAFDDLPPGLADPGPAERGRDRSDRARAMARHVREGQAVMEATRERDAVQNELEDMVEIDEFTGGAPLPGGNTELDMQALNNMPSWQLVIVMESLGELQAQLDAGTFNPATPAEFLVALEDSLIANGMNPGQANSVIARLSK